MQERDYLIILYDYYGDLLNEDNKRYFEDYYFDNLSLSEIAENSNISRNAVHKHIKSTEKKLKFFEEKLKLYEKDIKAKELINKISDESLKKQMVICVVVFIFVLLIGLLVVFNRFSYDEASVLKEIQKKESFVVLIHDGDYDLCSSVLDEEKISYYLFDINSSSYDEVLNKLHINYEVRVPAIYVIEDGEVSYNITNIKNKKTVRDFIENNNIASILEGVEEDE